ncbi:MAG: ribonuclease III family protein [Lachnospiraceae bacterium]|nr:ribonuclease III family protein [Lachnospiraceae bacterium]
MEKEDFIFIQDQIGYNFQNTDLLQQAFIRRSYSKEYGGEDNEVLEFIGDKVLDLIVVKLLTEKYGCFIGDYEDFNPNEEFDEFVCSKNEAELTELKKKLVQKKTLAERIDALALSDYLIMGNGDIQNNINEEISVKEDLFEAIIGAVALDSDWDMEAIQDVVQIMLDPDSYFKEDMDVNYVELIQEWTLKKYGMVPWYHFEKASQTIWFIPFDGISSPYNGNPELKHTCLLKLGKLDKIFRSFGTSKNEARKAVCALAYQVLERNNMLLSIRDEIPNPNINDAISQLEILARRGYFSIPYYEFEQEYDTEGNPVWNCACHITDISKHFCAKSSSKKNAKKQAAYQMLKYTLDNKTEANIEQIDKKSGALSHSGITLTTLAEVQKKNRNFFPVNQ